MSDMTTTKKIRALAVWDDVELRRLSLSTRQAAICRFVFKDQPTYSDRVAKHFDISIQSASTQLKTLTDRGYLSRDDEIDPTGGTCFIYYCWVERPDETATAEETDK